MTDRNGYNPSKLKTEEGVCFVCNTRTETARHEIFYGLKNRSASKREGMWVNVCPACHARIHANPSAFAMLKTNAQGVFEEYRPRAEFVAIFGRNYRDDETVIATGIRDGKEIKYYIKLDEEDEWTD